MMFEDGKYEIILGHDEVLLGGLALGIKAAIGSTYNYMAPIYNEIISFFEEGDLEKARQLQTLSDREIRHLQNDLVQLDFFKRIAP